MSTGKFIIYGLIDPRNEQLRYIGKSCKGVSRLNDHLTSAQKEANHKAKWIRNLLSVNLKPEMVVIEQHESKDFLIDAEQFWIAYYRSIGCNLTNLTKGGEGIVGYRMPPEVKRKISISNSGKRRSPEFIQKIKLVRKESGKRLRKAFIDNLGNKFESVQQAAQILNVDKAAISRTLSGKQKTCLGRTFTRVYE